MPIPESVLYLRTPQAIRDRCAYLFNLACQDQLNHFRCDLTQLDRTADYVIEVMRENYPDLNIPFHSRWRHFEAGSVPRLAQLQQKIAGFEPIEQARIKFDLAIVSVLLDAGAGADWQYREPGTEKIFQRSEGLAVASFQMFLAGAFSSDRTSRLQADATGLEQFTSSDLIHGFQVSDRNPLVGIEGRVDLLNSLGKTLRNHPDLFAAEQPRPGHLVDYLIDRSHNNQLAASEVLSAVLAGLSDIWKGRIAIDHINLGDVWFHSALPDRGEGSQLVPFHKLSQWLTYSLLEPLQDLGLEILDLDQLTGLPEYRNGGLCLDLGLLQDKHPEIRTQAHLPSSEIIVEWRALTVIALDRIAATIRQKLNLSAIDFPLAKVLEGGTWAAGRKIARSLRPEGVPPIQINSDGTVF